MVRKGWLALPPAISLGVPLGVGLVWSFTSTTSSLGQVVFCITLVAALAYVVATAVALGVGVWLLRRGSWRTAASCLLLPAVFVTLIAYVPFARAVLIDAPDYMHFLALSPRYRAEVASMQTRGEPRLRWFLWRDASVMLMGETLIYLVYDESDEFSVPEIMRSDSWKERAQRAFTAEMGWSLGESTPDGAHHLLGHYYVVTLEEP